MCAISIGVVCAGILWILGDLEKVPKALKAHWNEEWIKERERYNDRQ